MLFAGGMIHLLSDSLIILRRHSEEHGQLLALILTSTTYIFLFILHVSVTGYFGEKLHRYLWITLFVRYYILEFETFVRCRIFRILLIRSYLQPESRRKQMRFNWYQIMTVKMKTGSLHKQTGIPTRVIFSSLLYRNQVRKFFLCLSRLI